MYFILTLADKLCCNSKGRCEPWRGRCVALLQEKPRDFQGSEEGLHHRFCPEDGLGQDPTADRVGAFHRSNLHSQGSQVWRLVSKGIVFGAVSSRPIEPDNIDLKKVGLYARYMGLYRCVRSTFFMFRPRWNRSALSILLFPP